MTKKDMKAALAAKASNGQQAQNPGRTIHDYLKRMKPQIERALPKHMDADRLARIALTVIRTTPKLLACKTESLMGAVMQAAQLGLEPGLLGHCYIIPYGNEATFIIGYRGLIELARRSGNIESIAAHEVCENDEFEFEYGLDEKLKHKPALTDRGEIVLFYGYAKFKGGGHQIHVMSKEEVDGIRKRSKASSNGPWVTDYVEMGRKTVIRNMAKYLPISVEIMRGIQQDESIKHDIKDVDSDDPDYGEDVIDITPQTEEPEAKQTEEQPDPADIPDDWDKK